MKLKYKYIVGTQFMFYELEMLPEYIESLKDTLSDIENKENVTFDFNLNISEFFEKIDTERTSKEQLIEKLIPVVLGSLTQHDLEAFVASRIDTDYRDDFDLLVEDALFFRLIEDEEEIE